VIIDLEQKGNGSLESRTVTICSGLDFVNINYTPMIARDPDTAKVGVVIISHKSNLLEHSYFVYNYILRSSTKVVQILPLELIMALPRSQKIELHCKRKSSNNFV